MQKHVTTAIFSVTFPAVFGEGQIRIRLSSCGGHRVMIPPLSNKGTDIKLRKGKLSRLFRFESNVTANELWLDV